MNKQAPDRDPRTYAIIGAAMEVHKILGPGFLEAVYQDALELEFQWRSIPYVRERNVLIAYKNHPLPSSYRPDFLCYGDVIVELKALSVLSPNEIAITLNYLKAARLDIALLINFGARSLEFQRLTMAGTDAAL